MSATIALKPTMLRATSVVASLVQASLMGAGMLLIVAMISVSRGDSRVLEELRHLFSVKPAHAASMTLGIPGAPVAPARTDDGAGGVVPAIDPLTPRMRAALEFVARRYHVSVDALEPIFAAAETSGRELRIDPLLIVSVIAIESRFNPFSESVVGAQGLMQVMPRYHQDKLPQGADELSFFDPVLNVQVGARILRESIIRNGGLVAGLQQFGGASDDVESRYAGKVLAEKARLEAAVQRLRQRDA